MADIPESLLRRAAEARAKALGVPVEQVLAEMRGEQVTPGAATEATRAEETPGEQPPPEESAAEAPSAEDRAAAASAVREDLLRRSAEGRAKALGVPVEQVLAEMRGEQVPPAAAAPEPAEAPAAPAAEEAPAAAASALPEELLRRSAEARAKALGVPVEQVLAEMQLEAPAPSEPTPAEAPAPEAPAAAAPAAEEAPPAPAAPAAEEAPAAAASAVPEKLLRRSAEARAKASGVPVEQVLAEMRGESVPAASATPPETQAAPSPPPQEEAAPAAAEQAPAVAVEERAGAGAAPGNGKVAASVVPRPSAPPANAPEGIRTQRLLTVVKARAIQQVKAEPTDKVNTWPHLMVIEFTALLAMTAFLLILSAILQAPLLAPANFNLTPNPSKAPWYFLGLQELLSNFDPQIAGVTVPTIIGLVGFMMIPYVDRNPSTKPSDRKFAIMLFTIFLAGSATLTILGVLFRGKGFNFQYPWKDGIYFDDLKDWVEFKQP